MQTINQLKDDLRKAKAREAKYNTFINEEGEGYCDASHSEAIQNQLNEARKKAFETEWTYEVTQTRRAIWNDTIKAHKLANIRGLPKLETATNIKYTDLRAALTMHGII